MQGTKFHVSASFLNRYKPTANSKVHKGPTLFINVINKFLNSCLQSIEFIILYTHLNYK